MTFKHVKFEDSPTMRALEKVAREKGLVKSDTITKTAQHPASVKQLTDAVASAVQDVENIYTIVARAGGLSDSVLNWVDGRVQYIKNLRSKGDAVNLNDIKEAEGAIDSLSRNLQPDVLHNYLPAFLTKGVSQDMIWNKIKPLLDHAKEQLTVAGNLATTVALQTKSSLTPSDNLMENILKLCSGLRRKGFEKQAAKLEADYFNYKQAQTLYETSKEKGEDLIEFAHPEGSHKLENVEGDEAVVEDILEKHLKSLQVVQKKPTGKLSNAQTLINQVKVVLAQDSTSMINAKMDAAYQAANNILRIANNTATPQERGAVTMGRTIALSHLISSLNSRTQAPFTTDKVKAIQSYLNNAKASLQYVDPTERTANPNKYTTNMTSYTGWNEMIPEFDKIQNTLNEVSKLLAGDVDLMTKINAAITKLTSFKSLLMDPGFTAQDRIDGNKEIQNYINVLDAWKTVFSGLDPQEKATEAPRYMTKVDAMLQKIEQLHREIIGA